MQVEAKTLQQTLGKNPARRKIECPRQVPRPGHRQQQHRDRREEQDAQVRPSAATSLLGPVMGNQRVGGKSQHLVEDKQREHVPCHGRPHGSKNRQGKTDIKTCLVFLLMPPHVPDRVTTGCNPERGSHQCKQHSQRFRPESDGQPGNHFKR